MGANRSNGIGTLHVVCPYCGMTKRVARVRVASSQLRQWIRAHAAGN